ncbi:hypothetical protein THOM_3008 [Trachipleistophora hominis]|uniref:Uncharacterized protein n=1 Tax=Trachipleistophora hominis TaxID=72359 RepID=L7JSN0_TRAHO|nr:hypothetical protein THOM_3008 [Trachipleistophora hominis]
MQTMKPEHKKYILWGIVLLAIICLSATVIYFGFFYNKSEDDTEISSPKRRPSETKASGNVPNNNSDTTEDDDWVVYTLERVKELKDQKDGLLLLVKLIKEIINELGAGAKDFFGLGNITPGSTAPEIVQ